MSALGDKLRAMADSLRALDIHHIDWARNEAQADAYEFAAGMADEVDRDVVAERLELAELRAEVAAYQGRPEGALPGWTKAGDHFERYVGQHPNSDPPVWLARLRVSRQLDGTWAWRLFVRGVGKDVGSLVVGEADSPRAVMRACEDAARIGGWLL